MSLLWIIVIVLVVLWLLGAWWENKSKFPKNGQLDPHPAGYCRHTHHNALPFWVAINLSLFGDLTRPTKLMKSSTR